VAVQWVHAVQQERHTGCPRLRNLQVTSACKLFSDSKSLSVACVDFRTEVFIPVSTKTTCNTAKECSPAPMATYTKVLSQNPPNETLYAESVTPMKASIRTVRSTARGDISGEMGKCGKELGRMTHNTLRKTKKKVAM
jgi:hypothetical protein